MEVPHRHVDGDLQVDPAVPPLRRLAQSEVDDVAGQRTHDTGLLGNRDEVVRRDEAAIRVAPAHQSLDAGDPAIRQMRLGLVVKLELALFDRATQVTEQRQPGGGVAVLVD